MNIENYTSYLSIRAALGVSEFELTDSVLADKLFAVYLNQELLGISSTIVTDYDTVNGIASKSVAEQNFHDNFYIFTTYSVANHCLNTLPLFSPKTITEDKSTMSRYSDSPHRQTIELVSSEYARAKKALKNAYSVYLGSGEIVVAAPFPTMIVSTPATDPVTNS